MELVSTEYWEIKCRNYISFNEKEQDFLMKFGLDKIFDTKNQKVWFKSNHNYYYVKNDYYYYLVYTPNNNIYLLDQFCELKKFVIQNNKKLPYL